MNGKRIDFIDMSIKDYEKRKREQEVRENSKRTERKPLPLTAMTAGMRRTYQAGQLWAAGIVGLLGGLLIALVVWRCWYAAS